MSEDKRTPREKEQDARLTDFQTQLARLEDKLYDLEADNRRLENRLELIEPYGK